MPPESQPQRPRRARELDIAPGELAPADLNAITDVPGVRVGQATTLGPDRRTLPAAVSVGNGYGKLVGATQLAELGEIETPILLDAALDAQHLQRLAKRAVVGLARVGSYFTHGSGDYAIAFSTASTTAAPVTDASLDGLFRAALESVEEAVLNSLLMATTTVGYRSRRAVALPHDALVDRLVDAGALARRPG